MGKKIFEITCNYQDKNTDSVPIILWGKIVLSEDGTIYGYARRCATEKSNPGEEISLKGLMAKTDYNRLLPTDIIFLAFSKKDIKFFRAAKTNDGLRGTFDCFQGQPIPSFVEGGTAEVYLRECEYSNMAELDVRQIGDGIHRRIYGTNGQGLSIEASFNMYSQMPEYIDICKHNHPKQVRTASPLP